MMNSKIVCNWCAWPWYPVRASEIDMQVAVGIISSQMDELYCTGLATMRLICLAFAPPQCASQQSISAARIGRLCVVVHPVSRVHDIDVDQRPSINQSINQ